MKNFNTILPLVKSYEEYEQLSNKKEIFEPAAREIVDYHHLSNGPLILFDGTNVVFGVGETSVIKIFLPIHQDHFANETLVMKHLHNKLSVSTPNILYQGIISGWPYIIMNRLEGTILEGLWEKLDHNNKISIIRELGSLIREVHSLPTNGLESMDCHWQQFITKQISHCVEQHRITNLPDILLKQIPKYLDSTADLLPKIKQPVILTGEYTPMNFLVKQTSNVWHINGLIDFGDSMLGLPEYDLLGPGVFLIQGDKKLLREFLISYGYTSGELVTTLSKQLTLLMLLHRYSNLNVQIRINNWQDKVQNLNDLENLVWGFI